MPGSRSRSANCPSGPQALSIRPDLKYTRLMENKPQRFTFADLTGRAGQPMDWDGDFDDNFTEEDYERRQYQRDARDYGY